MISGLFHLGKQTEVILLSVFPLVSTSGVVPSLSCLFVYLWAKLKLELKFPQASFKVKSWPFPRKLVLFSASLRQVVSASQNRQGQMFGAGPFDWFLWGGSTLPCVFLLMPCRGRWRSSKETSSYSTPPHHLCAEGASMSMEDKYCTFLCIPQGSDPGSNSEAAAPMVHVFQGLLEGLRWPSGS